MLVDINLLPQKEAKNMGFVVIVSILAALFVVATGVYLYQINSTKNTTASVSNEITQIEKTIANLQKQSGNSASGSSVTQLKNAIDWAEKNRIETIPVMRHLTALLPDRGFIQTFAYQETGTVSLTVQFDTENEASAYLDSLNKSDWITSASLTALNIAGNTNTANASSNQASTSTATTVGSNTAAASGTNNTNTAGSTATNSQNTNLQRYTGQFTIQFNQAAVKKAIELSKKDGSAEEGVSGS